MKNCNVRAELQPFRNCHNCKKNRSKLLQSHYDCKLQLFLNAPLRGLVLAPNPTPDFHKKFNSIDALCIRYPTKFGDIFRNNFKNFT